MCMRQFQHESVSSKTVVCKPYYRGTLVFYVLDRGPRLEMALHYLVQLHQGDQPLKQRGHIGRLLSLSVSLTLRSTVNRPVCLGIKRPSGVYDLIFIIVRLLRGPEHLYTVACIAVAMQQVNKKQCYAIRFYATDL
jgi:hypothetical protein